ncbi:MAG TPA: tyrosine-type recombinase/integrase [Sphingomicrobium sp.]|nr:tyrosine-type recombinase/integrase [Sphingomicrobium sp.]
MAQLITDTMVKAFEAPKNGNKIVYDEKVKGFGVRVTAGGSRSFVLNYRTRGGRERRFTIGQYPDWKTVAARNEATELKKRIDRGEDPLADIEADREAKTVDDLCDRFIDDFLPKKRPSTRRDYKRFIENDVRPVMKHLKVADVKFDDIDGLHRKITKRGSPYAANRAVALLSKMFAQSIKWGWRSDNPAKGVERNTEQKRTRYLTAEEMSRLTGALAKHEDQQAANIIRLLLLTGARRGEAQAARWADLDLANGVWTKPGATTKQKTEHRVPLSAPARQLLVEVHAAAQAEAKSKNPDISEYVFPGRGGQGHRLEIKNDWADLCKAAKITGARIHDLRHTYASMIASGGGSLPLIGALLGHTQPATTARYAHLFDDPLRKATEQVGALVMNQPSGEVLPLKGGAR